MVDFNSIYYFDVGNGFSFWRLIHFNFLHANRHQLSMFISPSELWGSIRMTTAKTNTSKDNKTVHHVHRLGIVLFCHCCTSHPVIINGAVCESQGCTEALASVLIADRIYRKPWVWCWKDLTGVRRVFISRPLSVTGDFHPLSKRLLSKPFFKQSNKYTTSCMPVCCEPSPQRPYLTASVVPFRRINEFVASWGLPRCFV